ncbi:forkhead box protein D4 isoform X2 [Tribolium castaneum]|uniref:forkhead box protein D4 isoform X2 n=1 Tax=Tribolium castaneum TaxID=7070 RepID=UPI00046C1D04|nr:PREDICTED: forkhead box protein D4 isoform X2 [Tribolium castaneum]|eukprot:XP_008200692.1 PREDICTED: forkhead box protein D4 isoform X2 [Tribolium castaneum]
MCSNETPANTSPRLPMPFALEGGPRALLPIDQYRLQLYQYAVAERLRYPLLNPFPTPLTCYPLFPRALQPEEPKPQHSYIGLIAMAILSSPEGKLVLSDIYQHILDHYPYFRTRGPGWRNSIRHNLSLNDCFIKAGRSANGKGHYWAIHPANVDDFRKGDFRRRKAQRKVPARGPSRKRQFDVASLLAPDSGEDTNEEDIDVVSSDQHQETSPKQWPNMFPIVNYYQALLQARPGTTAETATDTTDS